MAGSRFEEGAASWDENAGRVLAGQRVAEAVLARVPVTSQMTVVDYGCGTGLVTLVLQPHVGTVVGMDSSPAMLSVLRKKADAAKLTGVDTILVDLQTDGVPDVRADLVVSAMTLHHVQDVASVVGKLAQMLTPGGWLCLVDLDVEDGTFHPDPTGVFHHGIDRQWLVAELRNLGFCEVRAETANTIVKPGPDGDRQYPVFLVSGRSSAQQ